MGRVFSFEEIHHGKVPRIESFGDVREFVSVTFGAQAGILAASICGTVASGRIGIRSDFDIVAVYASDAQKSVFKTARNATEHAAQLFVPLEVILVRDDEAARGDHTISRSFADHLGTCENAGCAIKKSGAGQTVCGLLKLEESADRFAEVREYSLRKVGSLRKRHVRGGTLSEGERLRHLQKLLEAPVHVARKFLWAKKLIRGDDSRQFVISTYQDCEPDLAGQFLTLVEADINYSRFLDDVLGKSKPNGLLYDKHLEEIGKLAIPVIDFIDAVIGRCAQ